MQVHFLDSPVDWFLYFLPCANFTELSDIRFHFRFRWYQYQTRPQKSGKMRKIYLDSLGKGRIVLQDNLTTFQALLNSREFYYKLPHDAYQLLNNI